MQKERIYKRERQTVFDILIQYGGAISGLFDFLNENNLTSLDVPEGKYIAPDVLNKDVAGRFLSREIETGILENVTGIIALTNDNDRLITNDNDNIIFNL